ncbi:hypothetical protein HWQ46_15095 [Shewanella sp. D64]|uniref:hypothetical protein n=1 Tax=unclassified Shewanella TaxID=196818 RepID=UPI0022BA2FD0|nr:MULTISPECIES: hypothetical protein [unclassified Shewanella]MEC4726877.1 hypothetical protein [Shewanella sp. D64]MEC4738626.1 hypothetical protein [Shewanella sp. E94]WBJ93841.1 hypothetical protein HWQ47_18170 [Shewanella sp. MTB7]
MTFKFYMFILILLFISAKSHASGGTGSGLIDNIYVNNGWTMVHVPSITNNPDNCPSVSYFAIRPSDANYLTLHSTLLAAFMAGEPVRFWLNGCSGQNNNHPKIVSVWVY